jgi:hypothetical protein
MGFVEENNCWTDVVSKKRTILPFKGTRWARAPIVDLLTVVQRAHFRESAAIVES